MESTLNLIKIWYKKYWNKGYQETFYNLKAAVMDGLILVIK
jgi:hypothetical protein